MTNRKRVAPLVVLVVLVAAATVLFLRRGQSAEQLIASGTVDATEADLGFQAPGRIEGIGPHEGDAVTPGVELARLDRSELEARRATALAQAGAARARLDELEHGFRPQEVTQGRAAYDAARERLEDARRELERTRALYEGGAESREELDRAHTAFEVREAEAEQARAQLGILSSGSRAEEIAAQRAVLAQAEASVRQVDAQLRNAVIVAPFAGVVTVRHREPGEAVPAGAPVLTVLDPGDRWVRIYVREDQIGRVGLGQPASISSDTYPDRAYQGRVTFIASEAEFTPSNVQTAEERARLVYEVKVRITGDARQELKVGVPADVRLEPRGAASVTTEQRESR
jgi:HlyD family secretion protein